MHLFGYRFRIGLKGEYAFGDICWDASAQKWTWQILPNYPPIPSQHSQIEIEQALSRFPVNSMAV
jgi:hypothetical protein